MARRITHRSEDDSLKDAKRKQDEARDAAKFAERRALEVGESINGMQLTETELQKRIEELDAKVGPKLAELGVLEEQIQEKSLELRQLESALITRVDEKVALIKKIEDLQREYEQKIEEASNNFLQNVKLHNESLERTRTAIAEAEARRRVVEADVDTKLEEVEALERRANALRGAEQKVAAVEERLAAVELQILEKLVELKKVEDNVQLMTSQVNGANVRLEEARSLRLAEERRVAELQEQLSVKEQDITNKLRQLRTVQEGVNNELARIERKKHELELKKALGGVRIEIVE